MQPPISDYGFLSDLRSSALVSKDGSVDWWCPQRFDSPSVFARLLDPGGGHWRLAPAAAGSAGHRVHRSYQPDTLVLRTVHRTPEGSVAVTDALAGEPGARAHELGMNSPAVLVRVVEGLSGRVPMTVEFRPRPQYSLTAPYLKDRADGAVLAGAGPVDLVLRCHGLRLRADDDRVRQSFEIAEGQVLGFDLAYGAAYGDPPAELDPVAAVTDTVQAWQAFRELHQYEGRYQDLVRRSATVLTGLTYARSGAVTAAATTSLPEVIGGDRNYDYRFAWLRDFAMTLRALWVAACPAESSRLFAWATRSIGRIGAEPIPVLFGLEGERDVYEHECPRLAGYAGSTPVRVGNDAWQQRQSDVPGEIVSAAWLLRDYLGDEFDDEMLEMVLGLTEQVAATWRLPDRGIWEPREKERHFLSSKVLCWVALDKAVQLGPHLGERADVRRWAAIRDEIRATVLREGFDERSGAYTGAFGSSELDASALYLPVMGFLPADDPRMRATIAAVERELGGPGGLIRRWQDEPGGFLLCSFWLVECLAMAGERERAASLFEQITGHANDLGLLSEQIDLDSGAHLGNTPQALSHIGLINAAWRLTESGGQ
ncbi:glycoside hydrolase family 15 protein [Verrucosispora sp. FIM060022]|uniref:glycoside hydrolase family 15 protein n=1 Tax=Verrucosispora sp. FIM060022 TaxID=1479020 RepID=UPI000F878356|nr:glycoside hydrolase family 15 protein [Verrucosispora sp. FIM060022]RUL93170.1 glycoside hydrolase family 15 protein [Verrucosispora sp. FIM060022]